MKSLYGQYIFEKEGFQILETEYGFVSYKFILDAFLNLYIQVHIGEAYIVPEHRGKGLLGNFLEEIYNSARSRGITVCTTSVDHEINNSSRNINLYIERYGFEVISQPEGNNTTFLIRSI